MTKGKGQPQAYGDESYWDNRYSQDVGSFDWYQRYAGLAPLINMYLPKSSNVLMVGCGNAGLCQSQLYSNCKYLVQIYTIWHVLTGRCYLVVVGTVISEEMVNDGHEAITNIDISQVVIDAMKEKYKYMPQLQCNVHFILLFGLLIAFM
jgi:hypothetical protein